MQDTKIIDFQQCLKCNICTEVCPMMEVNPDYPGPKQAGPDGERYRLKDPAFFDKSIKYCLNCKRCEVACPSGVKVGDIITRAKLRYGQPENQLRNFALSSTDLVGGLATTFAPIANPLLGLPLTRQVMDSVVGVSSKANMPSYSEKRFEQWFKGQKAEQEQFPRKVDYFHGCYVNYNFPELGKDFVTLMNACGYGVRLLENQKCCGVAMIANGFVKQAKKAARTNLASIKKTEGPVLTTSSSCTLTLKEEYEGILGEDCSVAKEKVCLAVKWLYDKIDRGEIRLAFKKGLRIKAVYHTPCHMQRMGTQFYTIELLKLIPGMELTVLEQKCCGIAGTFGFKKENYELSQKIGASLYEDIREAHAQMVITDCETCKWQIEGGTGMKVYNPITLLASVIDKAKTAELNKS